MECDKAKQFEITVQAALDCIESMTLDLLKSPDKAVKLNLDQVLGIMKKAQTRIFNQIELFEKVIEGINSRIFSYSLFTCLNCICEFPFDQKWKLLYRACENTERVIAYQMHSL